MQKLINQQRLLNTFLELVKIDTGSDINSSTSPSTQKQLILQELLKEKLISLGLHNVNLNEFGILSGELSANQEKKSPVIGLIAHVDTSSDVATGPVNPQIHHYKDGDIELKNGVKISASDLERFHHQTIITSDGTTLLGADDKAGVAEILEILAVLQENPHMRHSCIKVAFTPDEEIGRGTEYFDIKNFGADFAYTIDGSSPTDIDTETFNAFNPQIIITGSVVHTGYAYQKMVSAIELANQFMNKLPQDETPATTKEKEGYFHVLNIAGSAHEVKIDMLVRDFNYHKAQKRIAFLHSILADMQRQYPQAQFQFAPNEKYHNMNEKFSTFPDLLDVTKQALRLSGLEPQETYVRGGTDGAELTLRGLLTPNLGAGGENFHSFNEFISLECMIKCCENILNIIKLWADK